jgi:glyoxylase-like metal-dependent hydrolase (beta-lactamase superfamily II)
MSETYNMLDFTCQYGESEQHVYPVVLLGERETGLTDCGDPGSWELLELQLKRHNIRPESISALVLTHQDDDHIGAAAEIKKSIPRFMCLRPPKRDHIFWQTTP